MKAISSAGTPNEKTFELISHNIPIDGLVVAVEPKRKLATTWGALKKQ